MILNQTSVRTTTALLILALTGATTGMAQTTQATSAPASTFSVIEDHFEGVHGYSIFDPRIDAHEILYLDEIHTGAHPVESGETYHCADFHDSYGNKFDLDIYVGDIGNGPEVVEAIIHKINNHDRIRGDGTVSEEEAESIRNFLTAAWQEPRVINDGRQGEELTLTYVDIHQGVHGVGDGAYFVCVDARDQHGVLYDLDSYVRHNFGRYELVETLIHKRDGVERLR